MRLGQVSMEYLVILGFAFLITAPLLVMFYTQSNNLNEDVASSQAERVVSEIVDAADQVYFLGAPSKKTLDLYYPQNILNISCAGKTLSFKMSSSHTSYEVVKWAAGNLSCSEPSIKRYAGTHIVIITAVEDPWTNQTSVTITG
ncbi:MAG: hypothetical protein ABIA93_03375 [Candidatus Woesearchaeota archaeon]